MELREIKRQCRSRIKCLQAREDHFRQMATYHGWWRRAFQRASLYPREPLPQGPTEPIEPSPLPGVSPGSDDDGPSRYM
jgi:hypothetical protein